MKFHLLLPVLVIGILGSCSKKSAGSPSAYPLKPDDFQTFIANPGTLNIVDFSASWCPPCQQLKPILESIATEHADNVKLGVIDVDTAKTLAAQQGVRGIPDVRFYINGKLVDKFTGGAPKQHIEQLIATHSKNLTPAEAEIITPPSTPAEPTTPEPPSPPVQPVTPPHPGLIQAPSEVAAPVTPVKPTIIPANGNPLPPGMSKQ